MCKNSRVSIARKVSQDGKLSVDEGNREIFPRCNVASATALKIDSESDPAFFGVVTTMPAERRSIIHEKTEY